MRRLFAGSVLKGLLDRMDYIVTIKEISLLLGIWVAIYGIDSWRREHKGKRQIELAEETLALFYEAKDAISFIRNPVSYESETKNVEKFADESQSEYSARKSASIVFVRYKQYSELFSKIKSIRYRFMAQIGTIEAEPFIQLNEITNEIFVSAKMLGRLWGRNRSGVILNEKKREELYDKIDKYEQIFWEDYGEDDPIKSKIEQTIETIESVCNNIIVGKGSLYSLINKKIS